MARYRYTNTWTPPRPWHSTKPFAWLMLALIVLAVIAAVMATLPGCQTRDVASPTVTANMPVDLPVEVLSPDQLQSTSQASNAGDQSVAGDDNTSFGGGNSFNFDGGTAVLLSIVITSGLLMAYLIRGGAIRIGRTLRRKKAKR